MHEIERGAGPTAESQPAPAGVRFVFPYADWAASAEADLRHLGYTTNLRPAEDGAWLLEVSGSAPMMRALAQAAADDADTSGATAFPCWVTWNADPDSDDAPAVRRLDALAGLAAAVDEAARRERALARLDASLQA